MKNFETPEIMSLDFTLTADGTSFTSGSKFTPPEEPKGSWKVATKFCNHNSGSHSEVEIAGTQTNGKSGDYIEMDFVIGNFKLDTVKDTQGMIFSNVTETGFTVRRNGHFNENENFTFNIQITAKDSKYHGAVGKTGVYEDCMIYCTSYRVG